MNQDSNNPAPNPFAFGQKKEEKKSLSQIVESHGTQPNPFQAAFTNSLGLPVPQDQPFKPKDPFGSFAAALKKTSSDTLNPQFGQTGVDLFKKQDSKITFPFNKATTGLFNFPKPGEKIGSKKEEEKTEEKKIEQKEEEKTPVKNSKTEEKASMEKYIKQAPANSSESRQGTGEAQAEPKFLDLDQVERDLANFEENTTTPLKENSGSDEVSQQPNAPSVLEKLECNTIPEEQSAISEKPHQTEKPVSQFSEKVKNSPSKLFSGFQLASSAFQVKPLDSKKEEKKEPAFASFVKTGFPSFSKPESAFEEKKGPVFSTKQQLELNKIPSFPFMNVKQPEKKSEEKKPAFPSMNFKMPEKPEENKIPAFPGINLNQPEKKSEEKIPAFPGINLKQPEKKSEEKIPTFPSTKLPEKSEPFAPKFPNNPFNNMGFQGFQPAQFKPKEPQKPASVPIQPQIKVNENIYPLLDPLEPEHSESLAVITHLYNQIDQLSLNHKKFHKFAEQQRNSEIQQQKDIFYLNELAQVQMISIEKQAKSIENKTNELEFTNQDLMKELQNISDSLDCKIAYCIGMDYRQGSANYLSQKLEQELFTNYDIKQVKEYKNQAQEYKKLMENTKIYQEIMTEIQNINDKQEQPKNEIEKIEAILPQMVENIYMLEKMVEVHKADLARNLK